MFSHEPPSGVYKGAIPWANSQHTNSGVLCPARLSSTSSIRNGGISSSRLGFTERPPRHRAHSALVAAGVGGGVGHLPFGHRGEDRRQLALEPGMQHGVRTGRHALEPAPTVGGVEERHDLGRAVAKVLVRLAIGFTFGSP